jgi:hypothetical protein
MTYVSQIYSLNVFISENNLQDFEKGILADLFPSSTVVQPSEKLLDDLDLVPPSSTSTSGPQCSTSDVQSTSQQAGTSSRPLGLAAFSFLVFLQKVCPLKSICIQGIQIVFMTYKLKSKLSQKIMKV